MWGGLDKAHVPFSPCPTSSSWHALSRSKVGAGETSEVPESVTAGQGPLLEGISARDYAAKDEAGLSPALFVQMAVFIVN